ncbi:MAG: hypothetical protein NZ578_12920 [Candidatus Binatia bacterium]|nr:hypothetical protein [Candidatus Binatia bacterium]
MSRVFAVSTAVILSIWAVVTALAPPPPMSGTDFFPLAMHNSWTHLVIFSGGDYLYYMKGTVVKEDLPLFGGKAYVVQEEYEPLTTTAPEARSTVAYFRRDGFLHRYLWLDSDGEKIWDTKLGAGTEQILPSPYWGDTQWQIGLQTHAWPMNGGQTMTASVKASIDPEEVRVVAGVFRNCLRVETVSANRFLDPKKRVIGYQLHHVEWYAPGVGLVRAISSEGEGTPIKSVTELVSYSVR